MVLRVDIASWDSPVAKQYQMHSIPAFLLYDDKGKLTSQGDQAQGQVLKLIDFHR